jgi:hypothetical protein
LRNSFGRPVDALERTSVVERHRCQRETSLGALDPPGKRSAPAITKSVKFKAFAWEVTGERCGTHARCAGAKIGNQIRKGHIGLMPNGGDERCLGGRDGTKDSFSIKGGKIIVRSATTCQQQDADRTWLAAPAFACRVRIDAFNRGGDLFGRTRPLHRTMDHNKSCKGRFTPQDAQNVMKDRSGGGGNQSDPSWRLGDWPLARCIKEPLCLKCTLERLHLSREQPHAASALNR